MCNPAETTTQDAAAKVASIPVSERDVLDDVILAMHASPEDAYWPRRLFDLVRDPHTATRLRHHLALAVKRFAARDPSFFLHERYLSEQLAIWAWPREVFEAIEQRLDLGDPSLTHFVVGRLWLEARRPPEGLADFYARATHHLEEVAREHRVGTWHESMCEALSVSDPEALGRRATSILATIPEQSRERAVLAILRGAARIADWRLYDTHRSAYGGISPSSEIASLDQARAEDALLHPSRRKSAEIAVTLAPTSESEAATVRPSSSSGEKSSSD